jgi:hypothetical protein
MQQLVQSRLQQAKLAREEHLEELARDPDMAHEEWRQLKEDERTTVVQKMTQRFGAQFANAFLEAVASGRRRNELVYLQPGAGTTPAQLIARGYRRAGMLGTGNIAYAVEVWVHPTGATIHRDLPPQQPEGLASQEDEIDEEEDDEPEYGSPYDLEGTLEIFRLPHAQQEKLNALFRMKNTNDALESFCVTDYGSAFSITMEQREFRKAHAAMKAMREVDVSKLYPDFKDYISDQVTRNGRLIRQCMKRLPHLKQVPDDTFAQPVP